MKKYWWIIGSLALLLGAWGCKKKPQDKSEPKGMGAPAMAAPAMAAAPTNGMGTAVAKGMAPKAPARPKLSKVSGGLSDPEVLKRAIDEAKKPRLGAKGFTTQTGTTQQLCSAFVNKVVSCNQLSPHAAPQQVRLCTDSASKNPAFKSRIGVLPRLSCTTLARILQSPIKRGATVRSGQGVGVVTKLTLRQMGADMIKMSVAQYGEDTAHSPDVQRICNLVTQTLKASGRGAHHATCVAVKAPSFNASALGDHIKFHTPAIQSLENLAIAQIAFATDLGKYLKYQIVIAAHVLTQKPLKTWPVPGCRTGDLACRAEKLKDPKVAARRLGLLFAILGHEYGHNLNNHARRKMIQQEVLRVNAAEYSKLTKGKKAEFINKLGSTALGQADEYESDETALHLLQAYWTATQAQYKASTGDALMGPQPLDMVYVALFMQSLSDAIKLLTKRGDTPALIQSHPASHARADRGLRVIIANQYAGHELAKRAYAMLVLRK